MRWTSVVLLLCATTVSHGGVAVEMVNTGVSTISTSQTTAHQEECPAACVSATASETATEATRANLSVSEQGKTNAGESVYFDELTWVEVEAKMTDGFRTVILPTGGIEQNGAHVVLSKHQHVMKHTAGVLAVELGATLVAGHRVHAGGQLGFRWVQLSPPLHSR